MSSPAFVVIDDSNPDIQYNGPWKQINTNQSQFVNATKISGPPFQNSLHGVNETSNFTFPFNGSAIKVYGTYIRPNGSGILGPNVTWECFIDDFSNPDARISLHAAPLLSQNNWGLCSGQFGGGNHTLTVIATLPDDGSGIFFYVDQIQYMPSADAQLNKSLMRIDSSDAEVKYSFGWYWISQPASLIQYSGNTHYTFTNGTWFTLDFSGSSISLFGAMNNVSLAATYFVDNHSAAYFPSINESLVSPSSIGMLFEVKGLTPGPHRLNVLYVGNSPNSKPLNITYLLTQNGTVTVPNSSTTIHRKPVIGGVIGLVLISLLLNILQSQVL